MSEIEQDEKFHAMEEEEHAGHTEFLQYLSLHKREVHGVIASNRENCIRVNLNILSLTHKNHFGRTIN
jgi:FixJ family two-component response regulator